MASTTSKTFGLWSGTGLVIADMVGAGVFLSTGYMAQSLGPGTILLAWALGGALALCGAVAYAEVVRLVPRNGGEYRFLSTFWHPALGSLAGWASVLVGTAAPIAVDALASDAFARRLVPGLPPLLVGAGLVVGLTAVHSAGLHSSARSQNFFVAVKVAFLLSFVAVGAAFGSWAWPTWQPPQSSDGFPLAAFASSFFYVAFAFSGWSAAVYVVEEFENPARDLRRSLLLGTGAVTLLYLVLNFAFVANLTPEQGASVFKYESDQVTLAHVVMQRLLGDGAANIMSLMVLWLLVSAMSVMTLIGPRILAAMAGDGYLPTFFTAREGKPPVGALILQGALSLLLVFTHELKDVLSNLGAVLVLFAALTTAGVVRAWFSPLPGMPKARPGPLAAALIYCGSAVFMLTMGIKNNPSLVKWLLVLVAVSFAGHLARRRTHG